MSDTLIIIPTYNEYENIGAIIGQILSLSEDYTILVVDDSSSDGTIDEVKKIIGESPAKRVHLQIRPSKLGLGTAYIQGFKWGLDKGFKYIFEMDADFSHDPEDLPKLRDVLVTGKGNVVIGSRYVHGVSVINWPLHRLLISYFGSLYVRIITCMPIKDVTAGFVGYHSRILETLNLDKIKFKGYGFQIEMKYKSWYQGAQIIEIPIIFKEREEGVSKMDYRIVLEPILGVIMMRLRFLFKKRKKQL